MACEDRPEHARKQAEQRAWLRAVTPIRRVFEPAHAVPFTPMRIRLNRLAGAFAGWVDAVAFLPVNIRVNRVPDATRPTAPARRALRRQGSHFRGGVRQGASE
jgi:hypothetical protein